MSNSIVIVGAGVIGLTTALTLKKENKDFAITVIASHLPGDISINYTSPFAGANWQSFAGDDVEVQKIDEIGYHEFRRLADIPTSGVWKKKNVNCVTQKGWDDAQRDPKAFANWFDKLANSRVLEKNELVPGTVYGTVFDGVVISVPIYLSYLVQQCLEIGIVLQRIAPLKNIEDARALHHSGKKASLLINCAGLGVSRLNGLNDKKRTYAVKGQVVLVSNRIDHVICVEGAKHPNEMLYAFPRKEGGTIIGGCFLVDQWSSKEDKTITQRILGRAVRHIPQLIDPATGNPDHLDVVKVNVGLRPFREDGPRIERDSKRPWLIHAYGAGGGGYQGSYGFAEKVARLVRESKTEAKL